MNKFFATVFQSFVATTLMAISFAFAQSAVKTFPPELDFFGNVSIKIYCTFSRYVASDASVCDTKVVLQDDKKTADIKNGEPVLDNKTIKQITNAVNTGLNKAGHIVYVQGPAGRDGTTTVVYQSTIAGQAVSPTAYINPGSPNSPSFQTTVPGDIWSTFVHQFQFENASGNNLASTNISAANLVASNTISANSTTTNLFASFANLLNLVAKNATINNSTSTNFASSYGAILNATTTSLTSTNATFTNATATNLFATSFATDLAKILVADVQDLIFRNATGTNLQLENLSTTNIVATGSATISHVDAQTISAGNIKSVTVTAVGDLSSGSFTNLGYNDESFTVIGNSNLSSVQVGGFGTTNISLTSNTNSIEGNTFINTNSDGHTFTSIGNGYNQVSINGGFNSIGNFEGNSYNTVNGNNFLGGTTTIFGDTFISDFTSNQANINVATVTNLTSFFGNISNLKSDSVDFGFASGTFLLSQFGQIDNFSASTTFSNFSYIRDLFSENLSTLNFNSFFATTTFLVADNIENERINTKILSINNGGAGPTFNYDGSVLHLGGPGGVVLNLDGGDIVLGSITGYSSIFATSTVSNLFVDNIGTGFGKATITVAASLVPTVDSLFDLGSATNKWRDLWVSSSTVHIGSAALSVNASGTLLVNNAALSNPSDIVASSTKTDELFVVNATFTNATTTSLFASLLNAVTAIFTNLIANSGTFGTLNATTTNTVDLLATNATITNIVATNDINAKKIIVQQLCVGQTCFTEDEMREFRNYLDTKKTVAASAPDVVQEVKADIESVPVVPATNVDPVISPTLQTIDVPVANN